MSQKQSYQYFDFSFSVFLLIFTCAFWKMKKGYIHNTGPLPLCGAVVVVDIVCPSQVIDLLFPARRQRRQELLRSLWTWICGVCHFPVLRRTKWETENCSILAPKIIITKKSRDKVIFKNISKVGSLKVFFKSSLLWGWGLNTFSYAILIRYDQYCSCYDTAPSPSRDKKEKNQTKLKT